MADPFWDYPKNSWFQTEFSIEGTADIRYPVFTEQQETPMTYLVTATLKFPSCFHSGWEAEVYAKNRKDAIKQGRRMVQREGHFTRQDGPKKWDAKKI